jgi:hypothetical protein
VTVQFVIAEHGEHAPVTVDKVFNSRYVNKQHTTDTQTNEDTSKIRNTQTLLF